MNLLKLLFPFFKFMLTWGGSESGGAGAVEGMTPDINVIYPKQYDFTEPRLKYISDFMTDNLKNIQSGGVPSWFANAAPAMKKGMTGDLEESMWGTPGERTGVVPSILQSAAITGVGGASANRKVSKAMKDYLDQSRKIDEYMATQGLNATTGFISPAMQIGTQMAKGPDVLGAVVNGGYSPQAGVDYSGIATTAGTAAGSAAAGMDWGNVFSGVMKQFNQPSQSSSMANAGGYSPYEIENMVSGKYSQFS